MDSEAGKRFSLKPKDRNAAEQIVFAKNQALRQPTLNLQIAKAYLAGSDNGANTRTGQEAVEALRVVRNAALATTAINLQISPIKLELFEVATHRRSVASTLAFAWAGGSMAAGCDHDQEFGQGDIKFRV